MNQDKGPPPLTEQEQADAHGMSVEEFRAIEHPFFEESRRNRAENAKRAAELAARGEAVAARPTATLRRLAQGPQGGSHLFTQYTRPAQLSAILQAVSDDTGVRLSSARELSLVDGTCIGVRVTHKGQK